MCKFESSQKDESRWQSTDSSKAYRNTSAFKCQYFSLYTSTFFLRHAVTHSYNVIMSLSSCLHQNEFAHNCSVVSVVAHVSLFCHVVDSGQ